MQHLGKSVVMLYSAVFSAHEYDSLAFDPSWRDVSRKLWPRNLQTSDSKKDFKVKDSAAAIIWHLNAFRDKVLRSIFSLDHI